MYIGRYNNLFPVPSSPVLGNKTFIIGYNILIAQIFFSFRFTN